MNPEQQGLEKLAAWQKSLDFAVTVCRELLPMLPKEEKYALVDQIRRAAQSIPANIAEGYGRYYYQEGVHFCYIARGSLMEVYSHLCLAHRVGYIPEPVYQKYVLLVKEVHRIISGYITYLKRTKQGEGEPGHSIRETTIDYQIDMEDLSDHAIPN